MYLLGLGLVLLALKFFEIRPVSGWDWWLVLAPFVLAVLWWVWADWSGYTKAKAMAREDRRRKQRVDRNRDAIGTSIKRHKR